MTFGIIGWMDNQSITQSTQAALPFICQAAYVAALIVELPQHHICNICLGNGAVKGKRGLLHFICQITCGHVSEGKQ